MELVGRWLALAPEDDGPFWALNLMRYREIADYGDGNHPGVSGREADDRYAPLGPLAAIGAMVAFHGDVTEQLGGAPRWHRVGIVRYPTRRSFFAMQQREDFQDLHRHKEAGMEFTIVMACHPQAHASGATGGDLVLLVERGTTPVVLPAGVASLCELSVEGVIVGDERRYDRARFVRVTNRDALDALATATAAVDDAHVLVLAPAMDRLAESIDAPPAPAT
jgi:hypothetical protein